MLKFVFWSLVAVNAALFIYQRAGVSNGREPARLTQQFNPDTIQPIQPVRLISSNAIAAAPPAIAESANIAEAAQAKAKPAELACIEIGNFDAAAATRFEAQLQPLAMGDKLSQRPIPDATRNMVYIPSQGSKAAADQKVAELRRLGVTDFYIIQDAGELRWGISLGVFKTEDGARIQLASLIGKGVHSARLGTHSVGPGKVAFQVRNLDVNAKAGLEKVMLEFPNTETHGCEPPAHR